MNLSKSNENILRRFVLPLLLVATQTFARGQDQKPQSTLVPKLKLPSKLSAPVKKPGAASSLGSVGQPVTAGAGNPGAGGMSGMKQLALKDGGKAQIRPNGQIRSIDRNGMRIDHNLHGERTIVSEHNGKRIVTTGAHGGYVQRPFVTRGGQSYFARTSYDHGVARSAVYRGYPYGGRTYYGYQPDSYYHPAFYGWASSPWPQPVSFGVGAWGWEGAPWLSYYGFSPYPFYAGPAFWLTDYLIAANLQAAYAGVTVQSPAVPAIINQREGQVGNETNLSTWAWNGLQYEMTFNGSHCGNLSVVRWDKDVVALSRVDFNGFRATYTGRVQDSGVITGTVMWYGPGQSTGSLGAWSAMFVPVTNSDPVALTPEVKDAIADEVKAQLTGEKAAAEPAPQAQPSSEELPPALDPARRTFVVSADLAVVAGGQECSLTAGDVIKRLTDTPDADGKVNVVITSSKKTDCASGAQAAVAVDELQEMRNHFQEQLDAGLKSLASKQGTGRMPKAPDTGTVAGALQPPPPDSTAAKDLQEQQGAADQTEVEVKKESPSGPAGGGQ